MKDHETIEVSEQKKGATAASELEKANAVEYLPFEEFYGLLRGFIMAKYHLVEADMPQGEHFDDVVEISLAKTMKVSQQEIKDIEAAQGCDGATSSAVKKVLLLLSIQKTLNIEIPAKESARFKTIRDLSKIVWLEKFHAESSSEE